MSPVLDHGRVFRRFAIGNTTARAETIRTDRSRTATTVAKAALLTQAVLRQLGQTDLRVARVELKQPWLPSRVDRVEDTAAYTAVFGELAELTVPADQTVDLVHQFVKELSQ